VACRADFAPQPENLGRSWHFLGLAAHLWGPGVPCWDGVQHPVLAGDCFCRPGIVLYDRSGRSLSIFTTLSTFTIVFILRSGQFHVRGHQMHVHLLLAHASCLHGFKLCLDGVCKHFHVHQCQPSALAQRSRSAQMTTHSFMVMNRCSPVISLQNLFLNKPYISHLSVHLTWHYCDFDAVLWPALVSDGCLSHVVGIMLALFKELSPGDSSPPQHDCFSWFKLWLGFYLTNAVLPCCMLYTYFNPWVEWGSIWYAKSKGKVKRLPRRVYGSQRQTLGG